MKQTQIGLKPGRALRSAQQDFEGEKVSIHIPEDILKQTTRCDKNFSCLSDGGEHLCKVVSFINNEICFVEFSEGEICVNKMSFGYSIICTCPTRKAIYRQYGI